jgi:hypothetical protein
MRHTWKLAGLILTLTLGWFGSLAQAQQGCSSCGPCTSCLPSPSKCHCPPVFCHTQEGPPCIHYSCGCPRPICDPCDLPHFGYFQPCFRRYPYPTDYSHCQYMPDAAAVIPGPIGGGFGSVPPGGEIDNVTPPKTHVPPAPLPGKLSLDPPSVKY